MKIKIFHERLKEAAIRNRFRLSYYGEIDETALPVLERNGAKEGPSVYISTGVHGNEPAGPMSVLELLRRKSFPESMNLTLFPLINPTGLVAGTRENHDGVDLNRDYGLDPSSYETRVQMDWIGKRQFDLSICLHEDDDGEGFYIYSNQQDEARLDYAGLALEAAKPLTGIDQRETIDEMPAKNGRMMPPADVLDANRTDLPEALRLHFHHGSRFTFTTETPSRQPIDKRIQAQCAVVEAILEAFSLEWSLMDGEKLE